MPNLNDIVRAEELVLIDGSVKSDGSGLCEAMYPANDFSYIPAALVKDTIICMEEFSGILESDNVWTIEEVAKEIMNFAAVIGDKIAYVPKSGKRRDRDVGRKKHEARDNNQRRMIELQELIFGAYNVSRQKDVCSNAEFGIDLTKRNLLYEMLDSLGSVIRLKPKKLYVRRGQIIEKESKTDEMLAATAFYFSMYSDRRLCLVSGDTDFARMLPVAIGLLGADDFMPYNEKFRNAMLQNPFKFYYFDREKNDYDLAIYSHFITFNEKFELYGKPAETETTRAKILDLWKSLDGRVYQDLKISAQV